MRKSIITFGLITILLLSMIQLVPVNDSLIEKTSASSTWTQKSYSDFNNGTLENLSITFEGEVTLSSESLSIVDNFHNASNISFKENVIVDTVKKEIKLLRINKTFGGGLNDYGYSIKQTPDNGFIITGRTASYGAGEYDAWLIKTDNSGNIQWDKTFGNVYYDVGRSVQLCSDDGFIICGSYDPPGIESDDIWLIKTDSNGNKEWDKKYGGNSLENGKSVQQTFDGGFIIIGSTWSYGAGEEDIWLIKIDTSGNIIWDKTFGGTGTDYGNSIQQTSDRGFIICGRTESFGSGDYDVWLIKTDSSGGMQWDKTYGGSESENGLSVQLTSDGGYIISGYSNSYSEGPMDMWIIKTDSAGNKMWDRNYGGSYIDNSQSVQQTPDDGYIVVGTEYSPENPKGDMWLVKTDKYGYMQWEKKYGGNNGDYGYSINLTSDGGYILIGKTGSYGAGSDDVWLLKTDSDGNTNPNGMLISSNLLNGQNSSSINSFKCSTIIPTGTKIKIQFSQDNFNWYNSMGLLNEWDSLLYGLNTFDLSSLEWRGSKFFYKMIFESENVNIPVIKYIDFSYTKYQTLGTIISQPIEIGQNTYLETLLWDSNKPECSDIKFQIRSALIKSELNVLPFIGPDGTKNTYYLNSGETISNNHKNSSWIQYKVFLITLDTSKTPILNEVQIEYNTIPEIISSAITPSMGDVTTIFNFTVQIKDKDNDPLKNVKINIDGVNYTLNEDDKKDLIYSDGKNYRFATKLDAGIHVYYYFTSDGKIEMISELKYFRVDFGQINHIIVEPEEITLTADDFQIFTAKGFDIEGNQLYINPTWEISGGGIIDQTGNFTADSSGYWIIYANFSGVSGKTNVFITPGFVNRIEISPNNIEINLSETIKFHVKGYDTDENELVISPKWELSGGGTIDQNGNFKGITSGTWIIYANLSGISGKVNVKITPLDNGEKPDNNIDENDKNQSNKSSISLQIISLIILIIIIIIIISLLIFLKRKKLTKNANSRFFQNQQNFGYQNPVQVQSSIQTHPYQIPPLQTQVQPPSNIQQVQAIQQVQLPNLQPFHCSTCGQQLTFIQQNNRYYCHQCQK